jgi:hypothetical protein
MADFPQLIPSSRRYSLGEVPATAVEWLGALRVVHRFADATTGHRLTLVYDDATTDAEWLQIRNHWAGQEGGVLPFAVPAAVWCGHDDYGDITGGLQWRYASAPSRSDRDGRLGAGTVELVAERTGQTLLSADAAPWFGTAVPLVAEGSDPGPPPPVVPVDTPQYVLRDAPPGLDAPPGGAASWSSAVQLRPTGPTGGPPVVGPQSPLSWPDFVPGPEPLPPEEPPNIDAPLGRPPQPGDPVNWVPQCASPGEPKWYFIPNVDDCNTENKTPQQLRDMLGNEYGVTAPSGMPLSGLRELYCKAAEAADYGVLPLKNDTVDKLQDRIDGERSKGRRRGDPIPYPQNPANPITTPIIPGGGQLYVKDNCGYGTIELLPVEPIGQDPDGWRGRIMEEVVVRYTGIPNNNGLDITSDPPHAWGGIGGVTPASSNGFYIENGNLWTTSDDGEPVFLGGGSGLPSQTGWVTSYKVIRVLDENGNESPTYELDSNGWSYTLPSP